MRPISRTALVAALAERIAGLPRPARVIVDGAPPAAPERLAAELAEPLCVLGRPVINVSAWDFLRPASLRLEYGHTDPDAFLDDWLDVKALEREVLGRGSDVLPRLWDRERDRAFRAPYQALPAAGVVILDGTLLLGRGLPADLTVHLWLSPAALARRTAQEERWRLPAYARYERESAPAAVADVAVKVDDPRHPALLD
ncbi:uridine kinase [Nonomuraea sp. NBC_01738]|uniref:uridine kinase n=1 Tax=Nonomuraea sp. NBC_01738 TaxID=2976003 RepID=UPI002E0F9603|nr:uridine kinase [Nonomuraea sp. NBC_01738]